MKTWIIRDIDGNLPTVEEAEQFKRWFTRDDSHPVVGVVTAGGADGRLSRCEWSFQPTEGRATIAAMAQENQRLLSMYQEYRQAYEVVRMAIEAGDIMAAKKFMNIED